MAARKAAKTAKKSPKARPALIPQPNGKGALLAGGVPGNKGGTGRPPSQIRDGLRDLLTPGRMERLAKFMDGEAVVRVRLPDGTETETLTSPSVGDQLKAFATALQYGVGTQQEVTGKDGEPVQVETTQTIVFGGVRIAF